ncbi:argonaute/piwi family protein [Bradyrhizobium embrapense]|uniref:argonaute/piwi family protein n=1 Tax=Bradyrhizobium embrapense TaxID=630921 RepID=UPI0007C48BBA|nr:hypothetical protein [Bradyrhizobium embrapense]
MTIGERSITILPEPMLEFGYQQQIEDPRNGLFLFGPIADRKPPAIRLGAIGTPSGLSILRDWLDSANRFIPAITEGSAHQFAFPGFEAAFRTRWSNKPAVEIAVSSADVANTIRKSDRYQAIYETVSLFERPIKRHLREDDSQVDIWFVVVPDEVWRLGRPLSRVSRSEAIYSRPSLGPRVARRLFREPSLFSEEMDAAEVYRYELNFHHQLKARLVRSRAVIQVVRESTLSGGSSNEDLHRRRLQDPATVAWNLGTTTFFKSGGRPWKLANVRDGVCYIGLVFKMNTADPTKGNACCGAQMFLDSGDGLVFKGAMGPWYSSQTREFHLPRDEAKNLISRLFDSYVQEHKREPRELFIHGKTRFSNEEWDGFRSGVPSHVNLVGVRIIRSNEMKLFGPGSLPVIRGSCYRLSRNRALLWTTGYIPQLDTYPGREVPNPLLVEVCRGEADLDEVLKDVLGLTKVNFNSCLFADGLPVTLRFADAVGEVLTAAPMNQEAPLPFRYYI